MGRTGRPALTLGTTAVLVAAAGTCVVLTRGEPPVAEAATTLAAVSHATIVSPSGRTVPARAGQRVPNGDVVRTGPAGSVQLLTRGRTVYLDGGAAVAVVDGAHQQLRTGAAVVDAQHGPGVRLDLAGDVVAIPDGSATEARRSVTVEVGALAGPAEITSANARRLTVQPLFQAVINGEALPATTTPLHLRYRAAEARAVPSWSPMTPAEHARCRHRLSGSATAGLILADWTGRRRPAGADRRTQRAGAADGDRRRHLGRQRAGSL